MNTTTPKQYTKNLIHWFLHTKVGAWIGYHIGISGYNRIDVLINGKPISHSFNSRTNKGAALTGSLMSGSSLGSISSPLPPLYIALSTSSLTPAAGDTTLTGETAASGLARAIGTAGSYSAPGALDGSASYIVSKTFAAGATATIQSAALFDAASTGNLFVEANLSSSASVNNGDSLTINWTINV